MKNILLLASLASASGICFASAATPCVDISGQYRLMQSCTLGQYQINDTITVSGTSCSAIATGKALVVTPGPSPYDTCAMFLFDCTYYGDYGLTPEECQAKAIEMEAKGECARSTIEQHPAAAIEMFSRDQISLTLSRSLGRIGSCQIHSKIQDRPFSP